MAIQTRKLSANNPRLIIDLREMFNGKQPDSTSFRASVGQSILDQIRDRTAEFIGQDGKRFRNYSKDYAKSLEFKAFGKSKNSPNLELTGDMLGLMDILESNKNQIVIGWADSSQAEKAHGHITGSVGVTRDFFGLPDGSYDSIASEFKPLTNTEEPDSLFNRASLILLRDLFSGEN